MGENGDRIGEVRRTTGVDIANGIGAELHTALTTGGVGIDYGGSIIQAQRNKDEETGTSTFHGIALSADRVELMGHALFDYVAVKL